MPDIHALRTWDSGPQRKFSGPGSQDLGSRPSTRGFRTWVSGPQREVSGPGSQDLGFRPAAGWANRPSHYLRGAFCIGGENCHIQSIRRKTELDGWRDAWNVRPVGWRDGLRGSFCHPLNNIIIISVINIQFSHTCNEYLRTRQSVLNTFLWFGNVCACDNFDVVHTRENWHLKYMVCFLKNACHQHMCNTSNFFISSFNAE